MPPTPLNVNVSSANELAIIRDLPLDGLRKALAEIQSAKKPIISPKILCGTIERSIERDGARVLTKQLIALGNFARHSGNSPAETIEALTLGLRTRWKEDSDLRKWATISPILLELLQTEHVAITVKSVDLSYDFEHKYNEAKIITDIRPIFNEPRTKIIGAIVNHVMRLSYYDASTNLLTTSIAMDVDDLVQLELACKEALGKGAIATDLITKKAGLDTFVPGDDNEFAR